jgi:hypothetical protein
MIEINAITPSSNMNDEMRQGLNNTATMIQYFLLGSSPNESDKMKGSKFRVDIGIDISKSVKLSYLNWGAIATIWLLEQGDHKVVLNVAHDKGKDSYPSMVVKNDYDLLCDLSIRHPHYFPKALGESDIGKLKIIATEYVPQIAELNASGGIVGNMIKDVNVEFNAAANGEGTETLNPIDSKDILSNMISINADVFVQSNEEILLVPALNAGDFVAVEGGGIKQITARANRLDPKRRSYFNNPIVDPFTPLLHSEKGSEFYNKSSNKTKFLLALLLHFEWFEGREDDSKLQVQFWPGDSIVTGINNALNAYNIDTNSWWQNIRDGLLEFNNIIDKLTYFPRKVESNGTVTAFDESTIMLFQKSIRMRLQYIIDSFPTLRR